MPSVKALDSDRSGSVTYAELKRACHKAGAYKDCCWKVWIQVQHCWGILGSYRLSDFRDSGLVGPGLWLVYGGLQGFQSVGFRVMSYE